MVLLHMPFDEGAFDDGAVVDGAVVCAVDYDVAVDNVVTLDSDGVDDNDDDCAVDDDECTVKDDFNDDGTVDGESVVGDGCGVSDDNNGVDDTVMIRLLLIIVLMVI